MNPTPPLDIIPAELLLGAYLDGVFPMADKGEILWFNPEIRGVIPLDERFKVNHGLKKALRKQVYEVKFDTAFEDVMRCCAERTDTWIDEKIIKSYCNLHDLGFAHSVEYWDDDGLQGGLYGVQIEKAFFGESMFSRKSNASKIALVSLVEHLRSLDALLLDTQWITEHLRTFGAYECPRSDYLELLHEATSSLR